jgi:hypothetical protein
MDGKMAFWWSGKQAAGVRFPAKTCFAWGDLLEDGENWPSNSNFEKKFKNRSDQGLRGRKVKRDSPKNSRDTVPLSRCSAYLILSL